MTSRILAACAVCLWLFPAGMAAADEADWDARMARADSLHREAASRQRAADDAFAAREQACREKFLVNDCINEARREQLRVRDETRGMTREADEIERQVKREQLAARKARIAADAESKADDLARREAEIAARDRAAEANRQEITARKARQAEDGARRRAEREEAYRRRAEAHARKVAEAKEKAAARAAGK